MAATDVIDLEMDALRELGAPVHRLVGVPFNGCESRQMLHYPRQATFHPLKYLARARDDGLALRQNGLCQVKLIASVTEEDVYEALGLQFVEPELSEGRDEIVRGREIQAAKTCPRQKTPWNTSQFPRPRQTVLRR